MPQNKKLPLKWYQSLIFKLLLGLILIISLSLLAVSNWISSSQTKRFQEDATFEAGRTAQFIKKRIEKEMLKGQALENIRPLINALALNRNIDKIMLINLEGEVRHSSDPALIGYRFIRKEHKGCMICHRDLKNVPGNLTVLTRDQRKKKIIRTTLPLRNKPACHACHPAEKKNRAMLVIDSSFTELEQTLNSMIGKLYTGMKLILGFIILTIIIFLQASFSRPLKRLLSGLEEIGKGNLRHHIPEKGANELALVSKTFNQMTDNLSKYIQEIKQKNLELNSLYSIVDQLSKTMDLEELRAIMINIFLKLFNIQAVYILMYTFTQDEIEIISKVVNQEQKRSLTNIEQGLPDKEDGGGISGEDFNEFVQGKLKRAKLSSERRRLSVPLSIKKEAPFGFVLTIKGEGEFFGEHEQKTIIAIANHISVAVTNARLYSQSITDDLTGLYTKRYFFLRVNEEVYRYRRYGQRFSLMIIDVDKFKQINDSYGHLVGDQVLKIFAHLLKTGSRAMDVCARYGGDEFLVLLPETTSEQALIVAEKVRTNLDRLGTRTAVPLQKHGNAPTKAYPAPTLSIGIASCPEQGKDTEDLLARADAALYQAKESGRNRISVA